MDNLITILTKPDNVPIAAMALSLTGLLWVWLRQALRNDQLIREGRREEIAEEMRR